MSDTAVLAILKEIRDLAREHEHTHHRPLAKAIRRLADDAVALSSYPFGPYEGDPPLNPEAE